MFLVAFSPVLSGDGSHRGLALRSNDLEYVMGGAPARLESNVEAASVPRNVALKKIPSSSVAEEKPTVMKRRFAPDDGPD